MDLTFIVQVFCLLVSTSCLTTSCPAGYFFDGQHCEQCQPNCVCTSRLGCDSCITGATFNADRTRCVLCPVANSLYAACTECCANTNGTATSCTDCDSSVNQGYIFLVSGRCLKKQGCFQIDTNGFCLDCREGYYYQDNSCVTCDVSCSTCIGADNCLTCASGYYDKQQDGSLCSACPTGCSTCLADGTCSTCLTGYYNYNSQCVSCPTDCATCNDGSSCSTCIQGIVVSNLCIRCTDTTYGGSTGCIACEASSSFVICTACADTYYLDQNALCQQCSVAISNSVRCLDAHTPTQCKDDSVAVVSNRYYLLSVSCVLNQYSCRKISSMSGQCSACYQGYYLDTNTLQCVQCAFTGCVPANTSISGTTCSCSACLTGYYLSSNSCLACSLSNCATCPGDSCSECGTGYYLNGGSCVSTSLSNCDIALSVSTCKTCTSGYYLGSDQLCYACETNCLVCDSKYSCKTCAIGYYLLSTGNCYRVVSNCESTDTATGKCLLCQHGYALYGGLCRPCSVELGTLSLCDGMCPLDYYIESVLIQKYGLNLFVTFGLCLTMFFLI